MMLVCRRNSREPLILPLLFRKEALESRTREFARVEGMIGPDLRIAYASTRG